MAVAAGAREVEAGGGRRRRRRWRAGTQQRQHVGRRRVSPAASEPRRVLPRAPGHPTRRPRHPANLLGRLRLPGDSVWGTRLDFGRLLQRPSTPAPRMGHVRVRDGLRPFPPLPGRVPLWHGDSDQCQLELPGFRLSFYSVRLLLWSLFTGSSGHIPARFSLQCHRGCEAALE